MRSKATRLQKSPLFSLLTHPLNKGTHSGKIAITPKVFSLVAEETAHQF